MTDITSRPRRSLLAMLAAIALAGCTPAENAAVPPGPADTVQTDDAVPPSFAPALVQPRDTRVVAGAGFTVFVPAAFQLASRPGPNGVEMIVAQRPAPRAGARAEVIAFREIEAPSSAREQMALLAASKSDLGAVDDLTRSPLEWPGASYAELVEWSEPTSTAEGQFRQRFAQLALQVTPTEIVTAVAVAPTTDFTDSGVYEVLKSVRLDGAD